MKKLTLLFILIFSLSFFCACSNTNTLKIDDDFIMLSINQNVDGSTSQSLVWGLNSKFLSLNSNNVYEEMTFKKNLIKNVEEIRNEFLFSFALIYMANPKEEYKINKGVILSQVGYSEEGDYVGFEIKFTSSGAWQYYHQTTQGANANKPKSNLFYYKNTSKGIFPFSAKLTNNIFVGDKYKDCFLKSAQGLSFENKIAQSYKPDFVYNYVTYYPKFHSNADVQIINAQRKYNHIWIEKQLNSNQQIELSVISIYKGWWILFTLVICLAIMFVSILIVKFRKKQS